MPASTGENGLFDTRQYTYLPGWAKSLVLGAAGALLVLAVTMIHRSLNTHETGDFIVFYMSLAQTAVLILIFAILVLFSTRDANVGHLHRLSDTFIKRSEEHRLNSSH